MTALKGLSGLYPDPQDSGDIMDEGVLEARAAPGTPHEEHSDYGTQHVGYQGTVPGQSPFSGFSVYDGYTDADSAIYGASGTRDIYPLTQPGVEYDFTPTTHASPSPRIGLSSMQSWDNPHGAAEVGIQGQQLHGPDLGGVRFNLMHDPTGREETTNYTTNNYIAPNENYLSPDIPGQLKAAGNNGAGASGHGNADPTQGYGVLNTMPEFNAGHSIRREQHDRMPWDFTATHGEQNVPFMGRHPIEQMPLDGPDSPYFEQGSIDGANTPWEGRIGDPTAYQQPAEVTTLPANSTTGYDYYPALAM